MITAPTAGTGGRRRCLPLLLHAAPVLSRGFASSRSRGNIVVVAAASASSSSGRTTSDNNKDDDDDNNEEERGGDGEEKGRRIRRSSSSRDDNNEEEPEDVVLQKKENSAMFQYVSDFLARQQGEDDDANDNIRNSFLNELEDAAFQTYNYCIAIPIDNCHELLLELESVQRGILYHCPLLLPSCISGSITRLPLLYVQVPPTPLTTDRIAVTSMLQKLVQTAVDRHVVLQTTTEASEETAVASWSVPFATLEIDGGFINPNEVLYTVAEPDAEGTKMLQDFVLQLQKLIEKETGWQTLLPDDPQQEQQQQQQQAQADTTTNGDPSNSTNNETTPTTSTQMMFRPRIPFMRLPDDWETSVLQQQVENDESIDEIFMLRSDQGGNGISPIFWGRWCDDNFGSGPQRLREIGIYERGMRRRRGDGDVNYGDGTGRLDETAFPVPAASVALPTGDNETQALSEAYFAEYQEKRIRDAESALKRDRRQASAAERDEKGGTAKDGDTDTDTAADLMMDDDEVIPNDDLLLSKTRERLERIYEFDIPSDKDETESSRGVESSSSSGGYDDDGDEMDWGDVQEDLLTPPQRDADPNAMDEWMKQRLAKVIDSRAKVQSERALAQRKEKPPIEENTVFARYKDGSLVPENDEPVPDSKPLPPFPSPEHCTGFWKMLGSPTGFEVEEDCASQSDNLILRVDGTTAGGPILDKETRQKASGGTWKLTVSKDDPKEATLKIRLVIPPKKERILVLEGKLEKLTMSLDVPLTTNTFGIPALEERAAVAASDTLDDQLFCSGSVWIEDAGTKGNRDDIGVFSISKLDTPTDPSQYTITIPRNVRNQD